MTEEVCMWSASPGATKFGKGGRVVEWQLHVGCTDSHVTMTPTCSVYKLFYEAVEPGSNVKCPHCDKKLSFFDNTTGHSSGHDKAGKGSDN